MLQVRPLGAMTPDTPTEGTALATGALATSEIRQRLREALEYRDVEYPVPGHPPMCPEPGFIDLGSLTRVADSLPPVPEDAERRARNRLQAEAQKRRKDKETARKRKKAAKELQRRRRGRSCPTTMTTTTMKMKRMKMRTMMRRKSWFPPDRGPW
nr:uncharacterized protein LOC117853760 [Setaria viridis]